MRTIFCRSELLIETRVADRNLIKPISTHKSAIQRLGPQASALIFNPNFQFHMVDKPTVITRSMITVLAANYTSRISTLDQSISHLEDVGHNSVGEEIAVEVAHYLMNFDNDCPLAVG